MSCSWPQERPSGRTSAAGLRALGPGRARAGRAAGLGGQGLLPRHRGQVRRDRAAAHAGPGQLGEGCEGRGGARQDGLPHGQGEQAAPEKRQAVRPGSLQALAAGLRPLDSLLRQVPGGCLLALPQSGAVAQRAHVFRAEGSVQGRADLRRVRRQGSGGARSGHRGPSPLLRPCQKREGEGVGEQGARAGQASQRLPGRGRRHTHPRGPHQPGAEGIAPSNGGSGRPCDARSWCR
mmetsp:Transcript_41262/g.105070  ORF Transcript_41262/g.105070 Transcript_41262/m.105070 type:complete len:235 (+) Transcript_41262:1595-2299(+)